MAREQVVTIEEQNKTMQRYYVLQSRIYDATRWSFLFGRRQVIRLLPFHREEAFHLLEVGCGTGYNLQQLARSYPRARFTGLDVSPHMLEKARQSTAAHAGRVSLVHKPYVRGELAFQGQVDAILFSYSLTMINPQWQELILQAKQDLRPGGVIAVADFHDSRFPWFKRHMGNHHVRMDSHLTPLLEREFHALHCKVKPAYGGLWHYFIFTGRKDG